MNNPYKSPESSLKRELRRNFSTPLVVPLSVLMVIGIYAGYTYFFFVGGEKEIFSFLKNLSFEIFLASQVGMILIAIFAKNLLDNFLIQFPKISDQNSLQKLKSVARPNMYFALVQLLLLGLSSLTAIMSILNHGGVVAVVVAVVVIISVKIHKWYGKAEEKVKQIECTDTSLEKELTDIFHCWQHKLFPNF